MRAINKVQVFLFCLFICFVLGGFDSVFAKEGIKVGIILPLSGSQSFFGKVEKNSFEMALTEINAAGGVQGRELEFVFADDRSSAEVGALAARRLIEQDQVLMLGGGYSSSVTAQVAEVAQQQQMPFLINTGAADGITMQGWDYVFRLNPPASAYSAIAADFLAKVVQPRTAAIIYENSAFGRSQARFFEEECKRSGIKPVLKESYDQAEFKLWRVMQILLKVKHEKPDVVFMVSYLLDASLIMNQAKALAWSPKLYLGGGAGFTLPEFYELTKEGSENLMTVTLWHQSLPYPGAMDYFSNYKSRYGREPDYHGAEAYSAAYVIADVFKRAKSFGREHLRQALQETDMLTPFGPVKFLSYDNKTNQNNLKTYLGQWINGKLELVWPEEVAQRKYVYPVQQQ